MGWFQTLMSSVKEQSTIVNGFAVGDVGQIGTIYQGFTFAFGDDFDYQPSVWNGSNTQGKYSSSPPHIGFRRIQAAGPDRMLYIEPSYRGARSQSPVELGFSATNNADGKLTFTAKPIPDGLSQFLPTTYTQGGGDGLNKPQLISGAIKTWPSFMLSGDGDFVFEGVMTISGGAIPGYWPSLWMSTLNWPEYGELDLVEVLKTGSSTSNLQSLHINDTNGGADNPNVLGGSSYIIPTDRPVWFLLKKSGNTVTTYDDVSVQGTLSLRATYTDANRVGARFKGAQDIRLELAVNNAWDNSTFNIADWPKSVSYDWFRVWVPNGTPMNKSINNLGNIQTTPGGSWNYNIPSNTELFGADVTPDLVEVYGAFDNEDTPGMPTRANKLPGGMTVNMSTREATGTVPTTEGGRVGLLFLGSFTNGGAVRRAIKYYDVAPALQSLFANQNIAYTGTVNLSVGYTDFHSGNLGPHTYTVNKTNGSWLTISGNGTGAVSITGTAPSSDEVVSLSITCRNSIGQETAVVRTVTVQSDIAFDPVAWGSAIEVFDSSDNTKVFSDAAATTPSIAGSTVGAALVGKKIGAILANSIVGTQPDYVTDANGLKCLSFDLASIDRLFTSNSAITSNVTDNDNSYAVIARFKRGTAGVSSTPFAFYRNDGGTAIDYIRHFVSGANNPGITRSSSGATVTSQGSGSVLSTDQWYTVGWFFDGTTMTVRVNGVVVAASVALDTASITITNFSLGAFLKNDTKTWDALAFGGRIGEVILLNYVPPSDPTVAQCESYLASKWTN